MQSFLLGTTSFMNWNSIVLMGSIWLICASLSWFLSKALDALSLGESTATSLGVHLPPLRASLIFVLALAIGAAVAQTGLIAFVGLASPHLIRSLLRVTHNWLILLSSLAGGLLLVVADLGARWLIAPEELPVGILTAVLGGTYLLWLMYSQNVNQEAL
jgi:iron complex transport system permease protein